MPSPECEERKTEARVIAYEIGIAFRTPEWYSEAERSQKGVVQAMALECCLLHSRNLYWFFQGSRQKDDLHASDFIKVWNPPKMPYLSSKNWKRIHKMLAHLTRKRMKYIRTDQIQWNLLCIRNEIMEAVVKFLSQVEDKFRSEIESQLKQRFRIDPENLSRFYSTSTKPK